MVDIKDLDSLMHGWMDGWIEVYTLIVSLSFSYRMTPDSWKEVVSLPSTVETVLLSEH